MDPEIYLIQFVTLAAIASLWLFIWHDRKQQSSAFGQLDESLGAVVVELLERTKHLPDLADLIPNISLVNENPLASLASFIKALRGDISHEENFTNAQPSPIPAYPEILTYGDSETESSSEEGTSSGPPSE